MNWIRLDNLMINLESIEYVSLDGKIVKFGFENNKPTELFCNSGLEAQQSFQKVMAALGVE